MNVVLENKNESGEIIANDVNEIRGKKIIEKFTLIRERNESSTE
jgi:hypothetical protein